MSKRPDEKYSVTISVEGDGWSRTSIAIDDEGDAEAAIAGATYAIFERASLEVLAGAIVEAAEDSEVVFEKDDASLGGKGLALIRCARAYVDALARWRRELSERYTNGGAP